MKTIPLPRPFISYIIIVVTLAFVTSSCTTYEDPEKFGVASLNEPESDIDFMEDWLEANELMAYVMNDDESIYIDDNSVEEIQNELKATIVDNTWSYKNENGDMIQRNQKPLNLKDYSSRVAIVKWSYARGYDCQERPKGYKLPIHRAGDRNRKIIAAYETDAKGNWCIDDRRRRCKFGWKNVTSRFIKVKDGKLVKRNGKYVRSRRATMRIMVCTN